MFGEGVRRGFLLQLTFHTEWRWTPGGRDPLRGEVGARLLCLRSRASKQDRERERESGEEERA